MSNNSQESCNYNNYTCSRAKMEGFELCEQHSLEDKNLPVKQCSFIFPNSSKLCINAVPIRNKKNTFCRDHSMKEWLEKRRDEAFKFRPPENLPTWIEQLSYHEVTSSSEFHNVIPDMSSVPSIARTALEFASNEDSDELESQYLESVDVNSLPRLDDKCEFDFESSEIDPLETAGIYTEEEVSRIYLQKLKKLRALYAGQFKPLFHSLKQNRKQYLQAIKVEKETMSTIHSQPKDTLQERIDYDELKSMTRYHRERGTDVVLLKQSLDRRIQPSEGGHKTSSYPKCTYSEGSWRCGDRIVPLAKYCFKHILLDSNQVLFQECGTIQGGVDECITPIIPLPHIQSCVYHTHMPDLLPVTLSSEAKSNENEPEVLDFSDSGAFVVSEVPPENVMEDDGETSISRTPHSPRSRDKLQAN